MKYDSICPQICVYDLSSFYTLSLLFIEINLYFWNKIYTMRHPKLAQVLSMRAGRLGPQLTNLTPDLLLDSDFTYGP